MLLADFNLLPFIIVVAVIMMMSGGRKKRPTAAPGTPEQGRPEGGLMAELNRALQELKQAEREATARRLGVDPGRQVTAPTVVKLVVKPAREVAYRLGTRGEGAKARAAQVRSTVKAAAPDADEAFEDPAAVSLERQDYDEEAEQIVQARLRSAAQRDASREDLSSEDLSAEQLARRADRAPAAGIGGLREHEAWHRKRDSVAPPVPAAAKRAPGALARFATGRSRDAIVLSEILGRPVGDR